MPSFLPQERSKKESHRWLLPEVGQMHGHGHMWASCLPSWVGQHTRALGARMQTVLIWRKGRLFGLRVQPLSGSVCACNRSAFSPWISQRNRRRLWNRRVGTACPGSLSAVASVCLSLYTLHGFVSRFSHFWGKRMSEQWGKSEEVDVNWFLCSWLCAVHPPFLSSFLWKHPPCRPSPSYRKLLPGCLSVSSFMCLLITSVVVMATWDHIAYFFGLMHNKASC